VAYSSSLAEKLYTSEKGAALREHSHNLRGKTIYIERQAQSQLKPFQASNPLAKADSSLLA
jgi:hypothetical protein